MDLTFESEQGKLNIRVAAVIIQNGKILLEKCEGYDFYGFAGGRVKLGEPVELAIERELEEEFGEKPHIIRPLYVAQNFFELNGQKYHEIAFFFLAEVSQNLVDKTSFKTLDGVNSFYWFDTDHISSLNIVPIYIKNHLNDLPNNVEIIISD